MIVRIVSSLVVNVARNMNRDHFAKRVCLKIRKTFFGFFLWTVLIILFSELIMASKVSSGAVDDSYEDSSNPFLPVSRFYLLKWN